jgi:disulfide bond formation protein DsbB
MSYGDPNNPYGPPPQQQGYGYPQGQQPGYGYPQAPPAQQPYGMGAPMTAMPGNVSGARVMLWVIVGLQVIGVALFVFYAAIVNHAKKDSTLQNDSQFQKFADYGTGILVAMAVFALAWGIFGAVLAAKFNTGGNGVRITTMVFSIITAVLGLYPFVVVGLVHTVLAILVACFVGGANGKAWFNRLRY